MSKENKVQVEAKLCSKTFRRNTNKDREHECFRWSMCCPHSWTSSFSLPLLLTLFFLSSSSKPKVRPKQVSQDRPSLTTWLTFSDSQVCCCVCFVLWEAKHPSLDDVLLLSSLIFDQLLSHSFVVVFCSRLRRDILEGTINTLQDN